MTTAASSPVRRWTYLWQADRNGTPLNPNAGQIGAIAWVGDSYYHPLQAKVLKNMSHGFRVQGSYTWSKSIDTGSSTLAGDPFGNSISSLYLFNPNLQHCLWRPSRPHLVGIVVDVLGHIGVQNR